MAKRLITNAALTKEQVAERSAKVKIKEAQATEDIRWLMGQPQFRRWVWLALGDLGFLRSVFGGENTHETAYKCGMQDASRRLYTQLEQAAPASMLELMREMGSDE